MNFVIIISSLIIFSLFGTVFAITPTYYSEGKCDIGQDLQNYRTILQNNTIVKTFMQKYPSAISIPATGWDDSSPEQTSVHYRYEDNTTSVNLTLRVFGHDPLDPNDCFAPFSYTLNYQNSTKTLQITNYENDAKELHNFLSGLATTIPITQNDILANYESSDVILEGMVISSNSINNQTSYDIQVEQYYKGKRPSKMMTVFEPTQKPSFEKDDRVVLYIQQKDRYLVQEPSFRVDYECNSGSWGSFLAPKYEDILMRGSLATGNFPEFSEPDDISGLYKAGKEMKITYNVENFGPMIKHATVNISIFSRGETVFSDERSITVPACSGRVPLGWNFVPESGDHVVHVMVSGTYEVDDKSFQFQEPKVSSDFKARQNWSGVSLDRTVYPIIESPLQQFRSGVPTNQIQCNKGLVLLLRPVIETPACVKPQTEQKLVQRGWYYPVPLGWPTGSQNAFLEGFKDSYKTGETMTFAVIIKAGQKCGSTEISIIDANTSEYVTGIGIDYMCVSKYLSQDSRIEIPYQGQDMPFKIDKAGAYKIIIKLEGNSVLEKEFVVKENTK